MPTQYEQFCQTWGQGCGSEICPLANKICLGRGQIPCDVLWVGEAPGESEDLLGRPFCGPAGVLLDHIVRQALPLGVRSAFTNLVCCVPRDDQGDKTQEPDDLVVEACKPRLVEFVQLANPELIVCVGKLAKDWLDPGYKHSHRFHAKIPQTFIYHPAYILRSNIAQRGLMIQRSIVTVRSAYEEHAQDL